MGAGWSGGRPRFLPAILGDCISPGARLGVGHGKWLICPRAAGQPEGREKERKKKKSFLFIFYFRFFIQMQHSSKFSHALIFSVTVDHKAATNTPQMCTPEWDSPDHSCLGFFKAGQNPHRARFSPLTMNTVQLAQVARSLLQTSNR